MSTPLSRFAPSPLSHLSLRGCAAAGEGARPVAGAAPATGALGWAGRVAEGQAGRTAPVFLPLPLGEGRGEGRGERRPGLAHPARFAPLSPGTEARA